MEVKYVDHGIGNNFGDVIELNEKLKDYPKLHKAILAHELEHTKKPFSKDDLLLDLNENRIDKLELLYFILKNPRALSQLLPVYYTKNRGIVYDLNLILFYSILLGISALGIYLAIKFIWLENVFKLV